MFLSEFFTYLQSCEADEDDAASQRGKLCKVLQSMLSVADASLEDQVSKNLIVQLLPHAFHNLLGACFIKQYFVFWFVLVKNNNTSNYLNILN